MKIVMSRERFHYAVIFQWYETPIKSRLFSLVAALSLDAYSILPLGRAGCYLQ